ncbi:MAG: hypothetical protein L6Q78_12060 [Bacteroidia bacterium]|nr:hypothetical protein [Bacteroidia bacterium]
MHIPGLNQYDEIGNLTQDISEEIEKIEWTVYGKIRRITRIASSSKPDLEFEYTPDGHRSVKIVIPKTGTMRSYTYYVRDAQGNILATYSRQFQKTIDYANLSYAQVNTSLIQKSSPESFAWFIANEHANGPSGFRNALKNDILSSSSATDWFLNHPSFNPELILGMEEELAERVYFHTPSAELFRALFNTGNINLDQLCGCMKNRKNEPGAPNYLAFVEYMLTQNKLRSVYLQYLSNVEPSVYSAFLAEAGVAPSNFEAELAEIEQKIIDNGVSAIYSFLVAVSQDCPSHIADFQNQLVGDWREDYRQELSSIPDFNELFQNTSLDNYNFPCAELGFNYLFSLLNSDNSANLRSTLINQVQGAGITTLQQKKNWLIDWYFSNDPMGSIYLATLRNPALVSNYQTNTGMLYGMPFATGMENYFQKIKNYFGQSMFDQLVTEFAQQSNLYVDELRIDDFNIYGSSRLGVYEANRTISRRVARDLNNDNQVSNNEYVVETPEEVLYLYSSYQLERGAKRYELANHLGNVLTVISDKKTANFTGTTFTHFTAERISATDYSPFGAPLAGRTWNGGEYRFGFNSMEKDNEINGTGNAYDFGARIYDSRLGRWLSVDPFDFKYPQLSTYLFCNNGPLIYRDIDGRDYIVTIDHKSKTIVISATYYYPEGDVESKAAAINGVQVFNSSNLNYTIQTDMGTENYKIMFDLNVVPSKDPIAEAEKDVKGNSIIVDNEKVKDYESVKKKNGELKDQEVVNGFTSNRKNIFLRNRKDKNDATHEVGHTLGLGHFWVGFMAPYSNIKLLDVNGGRMLRGYAQYILLRSKVTTNSPSAFPEIPLPEENKNDPTLGINPQGVPTQFNVEFKNNLFFDTGEVTNKPVKK